MKSYIVIRDGRSKEGRGHFDEHSAKDAVSRIYYTDDNGNEHHGAHWSIEDVQRLTSKQNFKKGVTDWDKYVALNFAYADFNKIMSPDMIVLAAHSFFFDDEDAQTDKVYRYVEAMK